MEAVKVCPKVCPACKGERIVGFQEGKFDGNNFVATGPEMIKCKKCGYVFGTRKEVLGG